MGRIGEAQSIELWPPGSSLTNKQQNAGPNWAELKPRHRRVGLLSWCFFFFANANANANVVVLLVGGRDLLAGLASPRPDHRRDATDDEMKIQTTGRWLATFVWPAPKSGAEVLARWHCSLAGRASERWPSESLVRQQTSDSFALARMGTSESKGAPLHSLQAVVMWRRRRRATFLSLTKTILAPRDEHHEATSQLYTYTTERRHKHGHKPRGADGRTQIVGSAPTDSL